MCQLTMRRASEILEDGITSSLLLQPRSAKQINIEQSFFGFLVLVYQLNETQLFVRTSGDISTVVGVQIPPPAPL
jgi:hypothetical protein